MAEPEVRAGRVGGEGLRVLLAHHQGGGSGSVNSVLHLARGLAARGVVVHVVCPPGSPLERDVGAAGLEGHPLPLARHGRVVNARSLAELLSRLPVDVINSQASRDREALTLLGVLGRLPAPLVITRRSWPRSTRLENWLAGRAATRVLAVSEPVAGELARRGVPRHKLVVVHNGLLTDRIDRPVLAEELSAWRVRIGWEPGRRTVGIVARPKDQAVALAALGQVRTPVRLVLAGLDPAALARPLPSLPARHAVVRLPFLPDIRPLYDLLEVVLHPSRWDALPQAVLEAMALGRPVIASAATGHLVLIRPDVDGLLVAPTDPAAWAAALDRMLADASLAERLGRSARVRAREEFSMERTIDGTLAVYHAAAAHRP